MHTRRLCSPLRFFALYKEEYLVVSNVLAISCLYRAKWRLAFFSANTISLLIFRQSVFVTKLHSSSSSSSSSSALLEPRRTVCTMNDVWAASDGAVVAENVRQWSIARLDGFYTGNTNQLRKLICLLFIFSAHIFSFPLPSPLHPLTSSCPSSSTNNGLYFC